MNDFTWQFPRNEAGEHEGPNDAGITHFMNSRKDSVIRETIQNSLDARLDPSKPVKVKFEISRRAPSDFAVPSLIEALNAAVRSADNDDAHRAQFQRGIKLLSGGGSIQCLSITDSNTTGADDIPRPHGAPSKWEALTKGTGSNAKDQRDAAGSYGLGKFAAFAVTDIRTVLYSVAYVSGGMLHHRFQGKTILVSHRTSSGEECRRIGYLGDSNYQPLVDTSVPRPFRLKEPGTSLHIPGYKAEERWQNASIRTLVKHFFHAIIHGKLEVEVDGMIVKADNINVQPLDKQTTNFVRASQSPLIARTHIADIGDVTLRIEVSKEPSDRRREIALVRDAGMMITAQRGNMGLRLAGSAIPGHWHGFTAIIECLSHGELSLLREAESPAHDRISTDYISDSDQRKIATAKLNDLGTWVKERIRQYAEPNLSDDSENVDELAPWLSIEDEGSGKGNGSVPGTQSVELTTPYQSNRPPPRLRVRRGKSVSAPGPGTGSEPVFPDGPPKNKRRTKKPWTGGSFSAPAAFANSRFRVGKRRPTHSVIVTFNNHEEPLRDVQLVAVGEDGQDVPMGIIKAYVDGEAVKVTNGDTLPVLDSGSNERLSIEFVTREPVMNKTFQIKGAAGSDEVRT